MSGVNVLEVMDRAVTFSTAYSLTKSAWDYAEARAAVAELVAEAQRVVDGTTGDLHYLRAALANVAGGAK